jgi:hypothetical protein
VGAAAAETEQEAAKQQPLGDVSAEGFSPEILGFDGIAG